MISLITSHQNEIEDLCRLYGVKRLEVFGSAARGDFDEVRSDIDLIIDFDDYGPGVAGRFFAISAALETLFGRRVDFVFARKIKNPYFRAAIDESRQVIYDEGHSQVAA